MWDCLNRKKRPKLAIGGFELVSWENKKEVASAKCRLDHMWFANINTHKILYVYIFTNLLYIIN